VSGPRGESYGLWPGDRDTGYHARYGGAWAWARAVGRTRAGVRGHRPLAGGCPSWRGRGAGGTRRARDRQVSAAWLRQAARRADAGPVRGRRAGRVRPGVRRTARASPAGPDVSGRAAGHPSPGPDGRARAGAFLAAGPVAHLRGSAQSARRRGRNPAPAVCGRRRAMGGSAVGRRTGVHRPAAAGRAARDPVRHAGQRDGPVRGGRTLRACARRAVPGRCCRGAGDHRPGGGAQRM
jgi:hypothetical protein